MPQVTKGLLLGNGVGIFRANGLPGAQSDQEIVNAQPGSIYINLSGASMSMLYVLTPSGWVNFA